jgi:hypothetical protein
MITYKWNYLELFASDQQLTEVRYLLTGTDGTESVSSEGAHLFKDGTVTKDLANIVESDIWQWIEKDTIKDGVNPIKLAIENQLKALNNTKKVDFPWLAGTFTIG